MKDRTDGAGRGSRGRPWRRSAPGFAQASIGAAAMAAIAEKPELTGRAILMVAIPETLVILGFAVAAMIIVLL